MEIPKEPARIGNIECDVVIDRGVNFESEVTEYPVEDNFPIADHVICKPLKLSVTAFFSPSPVTFYNYFGGPNKNRLQQIMTAFQMIYKERKPITIHMPDAIYKNMIMTSAPLNRSKEDGNCYKVQLSFVQIRKVSQRKEAIPIEYVSADAEGKCSQTEQDAGAASQSDIGSSTQDAGTSAGGECSSGNEQKADTARSAISASMG